MDHTETAEEAGEDDDDDDESTAWMLTHTCHDLPELIPRAKTCIPEEPVATTFAASSATEAEENIAKAGKHADGSKPVQVPKRVW